VKVDRRDSQWGDREGKSTKGDETGMQAASSSPSYAFSVDYYGQRPAQVKKRYGRSQCIRCQEVATDDRYSPNVARVHHKHRRGRATEDKTIWMQLLTRGAFLRVNEYAVDGHCNEDAAHQSL
jgi:hypothetical protein